VGNRVSIVPRNCVFSSQCLPDAQTYGTVELESELEGGYSVVMLEDDVDHDVLTLVHHPALSVEQSLAGVAERLVRYDDHDSGIMQWKTLYKMQAIWLLVV
jgi:hypothetical protein